MNAQKFTQKSLEAIQAAQQISIEHQNMQISQEHLLYALLTQEGGLIPELLQKMQVDAGAMTSRLEGMIDALPQVSGPGRDPEKVYVSQDVDTALIQAEKLADNMKDEYVSVEHIFLSLISQANSNLKQLFRDYRITKDGFLKVLMGVRGSARVMSQSPEET